MEAEQTEDLFEKHFNKILVDTHQILNIFAGNWMKNEEKFVSISEFNIGEIFGRLWMVKIR